MLLLLLFALSFLFRAAIVFHNEYPPSSDIGFHATIINLILDQGTLPEWNPYHMGGEQLATPPGFHFFVSTLILLTGMSITFAELITAAFYSSIIVFPAYIAANRIWKNSNAGLLASFFAAISALSLEMISWGGYTNIVSLSLIILIFYLFLKQIDEPKLTHYVAGSVLFASLIITHTFSLFVVFPVLGFYLLLLLVGRYKKLQDLKLKRFFSFFVVCVVAGVVAVSPWILRVFDFYISASTSGAATGGMENRNLILANRGVDSVILLLLIVVVPAVFMFRESRKRPFDSQTLFLLAWFIVPIVMTQAYLFGVVTDYSRFMYFIDFPGIIIISAGLLYLFRYTAIAIRRSNKLKWKTIKKSVPITTLAGIIFIFIIASPWSILPDDAIKRANYYSTIHEPEAATMDWIIANTPEDSVIVADHLLGWWVGGITKRTTLSAADLEFLAYSHEIEVAKAAQLILSTNYFVDNGLIQVNDKGGYVTNKEIDIGIESWTGETVAVFNIKEENITLWYLTYFRGIEIGKNRTLADMELVGKPTLTKDENSVTSTVTYEDDLFVVTRTLVIKQGIRFATLSYRVDVKDDDINLYHVYIPMYVGKISMFREEDTLSYCGAYYWYEQVCGQIIFDGNIPAEINHVEDEPKKIEMLFRQDRPTTVNIKMQVGVFDAINMTFPEDVDKQYEENLETYQEKETTAPLTVLDYVDMIKEYDVSYVVCREQEVYLKFAEDSNFRVVFNSGNVAVFQVIK